MSSGTAEQENASGSSYLGLGLEVAIECPGASSKDGLVGVDLDARMRHRKVDDHGKRELYKRTRLRSRLFDVSTMVPRRPCGEPWSVDSNVGELGEVEVAAWVNEEIVSV